MKKRYIFLISLSTIIIIDIILSIFIMRFEYLIRWQNRICLTELDENMGWVPLSNAAISVRSAEYHSMFRSNSEGYRNQRDYNHEDEIIVLIGDSFVQGCEVNDNELFSFILEKETGINILNAGVMGYGPDQEYFMMNKIISEYNNIKHIFVFFYINDLKDLLSNNINTDFPKKPKFIVKNDTISLDINAPGENQFDELAYPNHISYRISSVIKYFLYKSSISRVILSNLQFTQLGKWMYEKNLMHIPDYMSYDWRLADSEILCKALPVYRYIIRQMNRECKKEDIPLTVFLIPSEFQYQNVLVKQMDKLKMLYNYENGISAAYDSVISILKEEQIKYIYPLSQMKENEKKNHLTFRFDKHLNVNGHKLIAEMLKEYLSENSSNR